jgi:hypothetical protein
MRFNRNRLFALGLPALLLLAACQSGPRTPAVQDDSARTASDPAVEMAARYLGEEELVRRFGTEDNPFLAPPFTLQGLVFMVFELDLKGVGQETAFRLNQMELQFGGKAVVPTNEFQLSGFWETRMAHREEADMSAFRALERLVKRELLPNSFTLAPGAGRRGLLVFIARFPRFGQAELTAPALRQDGSPYRVFRFEFLY